MRKTWVSLLTVATIFFGVYVATRDQHPPKVYDCFLFFNEFELLNVRLHELRDRVDYFVLVEADETFSGVPKPMYFAENKELFSPFLDKIIYVPVHEKAPTVQSAWDRERFQRNQIKRGLSKCRDRDIIMISDVDEIPRGDRLPELILPILSKETPVVFASMTMFRYFLNRLDIANTPWSATAVTSYSFFKRKSADKIRSFKDLQKYPIVENAGWHFTSMGGAEAVMLKIESWSHTENNHPEYKNPTRIRHDASGEWLVEIDEHYPKFIRDRVDLLKERGYIDTVQSAPNRNPVGEWSSNILEGYPLEQRESYRTKILELVAQGYLSPAVVANLELVEPL